MKNPSKEETLLKTGSQLLFLKSPPFEVISSLPNFSGCVCVDPKQGSVHAWVGPGTPYMVVCCDSAGPPEEYLFCTRSL